MNIYDLTKKNPSRWDMEVVIERLQEQKEDQLWELIEFYKNHIDDDPDDPILKVLKNLEISEPSWDDKGNVVWGIDGVVQ